MKDTILLHTGTQQILNSILFFFCCNYWSESMKCHFFHGDLDATFSFEDFRLRNYQNTLSTAIFLLMFLQVPSSVPANLKSDIVLHRLSNIREATSVVYITIIPARTINIVRSVYQWKAKQKISKKSPCTKQVNMQEKFLAKILVFALPTPLAEVGVKSELIFWLGF